MLLHIVTVEVTDISEEMFSASFPGNNGEIRFQNQFFFLVTKTNWNILTFLLFTMSNDPLMLLISTKMMNLKTVKVFLSPSLQ